MQKKREELSKNGVQMSAKFTGEFDQDLYGVDSKSMFNVSFYHFFREYESVCLR